MRMQAAPPVTLGWEAHDAALKLAKAIQALPEWRELQEARTRFRTDPEIASIMARYRRAFSAWKAARQRGAGLTGPDAVEMAESQHQLEEHPLFRRQHEAHQAVASALRDINLVLSAELELDFAANAAPRGGGCCG